MSGGSFFLLRECYLDAADSVLLQEGAEISSAGTDALIAASYAYIAERKALDFLNRSEQCRYLLTGKLIKKKHSADAVQKSLDYLEQTGSLDDMRYARAWLAERSGKKAEGRRRLEAELTKRGIKSGIILLALNELYAGRSEDAACERAYAKALRLKKTGEGIMRYLLRQGFSSAQIRAVIARTDMQDR
jgi:regulatory protein